MNRPLALAARCCAAALTCLAWALPFSADAAPFLFQTYRDEPDWSVSARVQLSPTAVANGMDLNIQTVGGGAGPPHLGAPDFSIDTVAELNAAGLLGLTVEARYRGAVGRGYSFNIDDLIEPFPDSGEGGNWNLSLRYNPTTAILTGFIYILEPEWDTALIVNFTRGAASGIVENFGGEALALFCAPDRLVINEFSSAPVGCEFRGFSGTPGEVRPEIGVPAPASGLMLISALAMLGLAVRRTT